MKFGSVCSGIEAASVAWEPLGWKCSWFSEIEKFPCAVLAHHYPSVPNLGDMTKIHETEVFKNGSIDLLVGGTPCQSFSVAGLRKGLADPRGNLALVYLSIADRAKPRWICWENVPGVLSSGGGRDFGAFLGGLAELGYGWAYRVLDAQYFGVPQRRRRVFVVGYLGDWRPAAAVLFERHSLQGHNPPSREKREGSPACFTTSPNGSGKLDEGTPTIDARAKDGPRRNQGGTIITNLPDVSPAIKARDYKGPSSDGSSDGAPLIPMAIKLSNTKQNGTPLSKDKAYTLDCASPQAVVYENHPADSRITECTETGPTVTSRFGTGGGNVPLVSKPVTFTPAEARRTGTINPQETAPTLTSQTKAGDTMPCVQSEMQVRRLTPRECERLQGFPDDYTLIPFRGKPASDGPRYKALGNSMAVPVMAWIGFRISVIDKQS